MTIRAMVDRRLQSLEFQSVTEEMIGAAFSQPTKIGF
jgi:hypothetical protein